MGSEGSICYLISMAPLVTAQHAFNTSHPGVSILYLDSSTCLDHLLPAHFLALPQPSCTACHSWMRVFFVHLDNASPALELPLPGKHFKEVEEAAEKGRDRRAGLFYIPLLTSSVMLSKSTKLSESQRAHL